jgi:hypothetical protein
VNALLIPEQRLGYSNTWKRILQQTVCEVQIPPGLLSVGFVRHSRLSVTWYLFCLIRQCVIVERYPFDESHFSGIDWKCGRIPCPPSRLLLKKSWSDLGRPVILRYYALSFDSISPVCSVLKKKKPKAEAAPMRGVAGCNENRQSNHRWIGLVWSMCRGTRALSSVTHRSAV